MIRTFTLFPSSFLFFLAQEVPPPDPERLSSWLIDAAALAAILLVFLKVIDHFKRRPSLEQELEKLLRQLRTELNQVRHEQTEHLTEIRSRVEGAHQRVDLLTHDLNNKLQRLPGEIVDLLHKTGVLASPR
jgi:uncharacterized protein Yka (UPF0111/DUF47 family)